MLSRLGNRLEGVRSWIDYLTFTAHLQPYVAFVLGVQLGTTALAVILFFFTKSSFSVSLTHGAALLTLIAAASAGIAGVALSLYQLYATIRGSYHAPDIAAVQATHILVWRRQPGEPGRARDADGVFIPLHALEPSRLEQDRGFTKRIIPGPGRDDTVMRSAAFDEKLRLGQLDIDVQVTRRQSEVVSELRKRSDWLGPILHHQFQNARREKKRFFNEKKLCLSDDIDLDAAHPVACVHRGSYFHSFLTNEICTRRFFSANSQGNDESICIDTTTLFPYAPSRDTEGGPGVCLLPIRHARLENHIGVSALAVTRDGYLVLWRQRDRNMQAGGRIVPTCSGSADWNDHRQGAFGESLRRAIRREMAEENGITPANVADVLLIGFFRWVDRGGKPEFLALARLDVEAEQLEPSATEGARLAHIDADYPARTLDELRSSISRISALSSLSVSLATLLLALEEAIATDATMIARMLAMQAPSEAGAGLRRSTKTHEPAAGT